MNPVYYFSAAATICSGGSYSFPDGLVQNNMTVSTIHTSNLHSIYGCDSIIVSSVNVNPVYHQAAVATVCSGSSYTFPDGVIQNNITSTATHTSNYQSVSGCDSIIASTVYILALPVVTFDSLGFSDTLCLGAGTKYFTGGQPAGGVYSGKGVRISGFNPDSAGIGNHVITYTYADINSCINAAVHSILVEICNPLEVEPQGLAGKGLMVYPNPARENITILLESGEALGLISIYDAQGKLVYRSMEKSGKQIIELADLSTGMYTLEVLNKHIRLIKE